jgi:hypothetical protein
MNVNCLAFPLATKIFEFALTGIFAATPSSGSTIVGAGEGGPLVALGVAIEYVGV